MNSTLRRSLDDVKTMRLNEAAYPDMAGLQEASARQLLLHKRYR
jgi:hypothetical protein